MTQPVAYAPATDFSADEAGAVSGRSTVRTANLDAEFSAVQTTTDQIRANLAIIQRDDTALRDGVVELHTLSTEVLALINSNGWTQNAAGYPWLTATAYVVGNFVTQGGDGYLCIVTHTSGVFATDLAANKWVRITGVSYADLAATVLGKGASLVGLYDPAGLYTAATVEGALAEILTRLASTANTNGASLVGIEDSGGLYAGSTVEAALSELITQVSSISALRALNPAARYVYLQCHTTIGDGGHGNFRGVTGASPGTYTHNNGTIVVPIGGDGSAAWLRDYCIGEIKLAWFRVVGDGLTNDTAAFTAALAIARRNDVIYLAGAQGSRFRIGSITVPPFVTLSGQSKSFGMTDTYDSAAFSLAGATLLLNSSADTITMSNGSALCSAHIFPYGMTFPQNSSSGWAGTAVTINAGASINTVDVQLQDLLICGFNRAVDAYWAPRLICNNVNFDCQFGIQVDTAGDPIRFFNCHGWPFATIAGTNGGGIGVRDRRSGDGFSLLNNADAGKIINCFAFGYNNGFLINGANGVTLVNCGSDDYNLVSPFNSTGFNVQGTVPSLFMLGCQSVGHLYGVTINCADDTNTVQIIGGLIGSNSTDNIHLQVGCAQLAHVLFGAAVRAIGSYGATNRLMLNHCVYQGITSEIVLNSGGSPYLYIGDGQLCQDSSVPMYSGAAIELSVASANSTNLPRDFDNILVTGTTNIFGFTGGWPGRTVHLRFNGVLTLSDAAGLQLAGNFTTAANSMLSLRFTSASQCYEISRSSN